MGESRDLYLALDQGTHSSRAILFDDQGCVVDTFQRSVQLNRIDDTQVEQDADELLVTLRDCLGDAVDRANELHSTIKAAGVATQRSSVVAWDRSTGKPLSPVLSWQDRRAWEDVELLRDIAPLIRRHTGLPLTPHYGASKIRWLRDEYLVKQPDVPSKVAIAPLVSFLLANLIEGSPYVVDHTNALRTQLLNLQTLKWDPWLVETFGLKDSKLPECADVISKYGKLQGTDIELHAVSGDQTAAMFGQGQFPPETALVNLGTGAFILKPCEASAEIDGDLLGGIAWSEGDERSYISEGTVNGCGAAVQWAIEHLEINDNLEDRLDDWFMHTANPPLFLNTVGGVGSPYWITNMEPKWLNQSGEPIMVPNPAEAMVATIESIVFLIYENFRRITKRETIKNIRVAGGLSGFDAICHRLANITGCQVTRASHEEATASGVAWFAAGRPEDWGQPTEDTVFVPVDDANLRNRYDRFSAVIQQLS